MYKEMGEKYKRDGRTGTKKGMKNLRGKLKGTGNKSRTQGG